MTERIVSKEEVATYVGKSWRTIYRWVEQKGFPRLSDGRFDLDQVDAWVRRKKGAGDPAQASAETPNQASSPSSFDDKDYWDKENKKFQAQTRELEFRKRQGELIEAKSVEDLFVARIIEVKRFLLSLERLLPQELIHCRTDREMAEVIRKQIREALTQFSRPLPPSLRPKDGISQPG